MNASSAWIGVALAALLAACGSVAEIDDGRGSGAGGSGANGGDGGDGGDGAAGGGAGQGGTGGTGGGGSGIELIVDGVARPPEHLTLGVETSHFIGGINRWVFDFAWSYDDPISDDEEEYVASTVRLMELGPRTEPNEMDQTWVYPGQTQSPLEIQGSTFTRAGGSPIDLEPEEAELTLRREGNDFIGHVRLSFGTAMGPPATVEASGPFTAPVP